MPGQGCARKLSVGSRAVAVGLLCALATLPSARAQTPATEPAETLEAALQRVDDLRNAGDLNGAVEKASEVTSQYPQDATAWRLRGLCHAARGNDVAEDKEYAIECIARSLTLEPWEPGPREIRRLASAGRYPLWVTAVSLPYLPGAYEAGTITLTDPRLPEAARRERAFAVSTAHQYPEQVPRIHPTSKQVRFAGVVYAFLSEPGDDSGRLWLRLRLYYQTETVSPSRTDRLPEAVRLGRACVRVLAEFDAHVTEQARERPRTSGLSVYVMEDAPPEGAEPPRTHANFWSVTAERTPLEWWRALCHNLGYVLLPPVTGFEGDDPLANGLMGELLFLSWLSRDSVDGMPEWDGTPVDVPSFLDDQAGAAIQAFLSLPPASESFRDASERGRVLTAGLTLYADSVLTAAERASLWSGASRLSQMEYLTKVANMILARTPATLRVPGGMFLATGSDTDEPYRFSDEEDAPCVLLPGRPVRYRVYLPEGQWKLAVAAQGPDASDRETQIKVSLQGNALLDPVEASLRLRRGGRLASEALAPVLPMGWYIVTVTHDNEEGTVSLRSLTFTRQDPGTIEGIH
jgi:hypothetical protein